MAEPSSALRTAAVRRTTASRTTADRVSPIPAATSSSSNSMSSSLNLVGTGVVTQSSIQFVEHYVVVMPGIAVKVGAVPDAPRQRGESPVLVATYARSFSGSGSKQMRWVVGGDGEQAVAPRPRSTCGGRGFLL